MQILCPKCGQVLAGNDINAVKDIARCHQCDKEFALSSLVHANASGPVDLNDPPRGTWYREEFNGFVVGAATRLLSERTLFGIPSPIAVGLLGGSLGIIAFPLTFQLLVERTLSGISLVLVTLLLSSTALIAVCGKIVVRVCDSEGVVFTGIGPFGWRRRFDPLQITTVRIDPASYGNKQAIMLDGSHRLCFGSGLTKARQDFVVNVLRRELINDNQPRRRVG
jgi:hypothetical protein